MATKIRLKRFGKKRNPFYRIVIIDSRKARDGKAIEEVGFYHPTRTPSVIELNSQRIQYWLSVGAQPSDTVKKLLELSGDYGKFKGDDKAKNTIKPQIQKPSAEEMIQKVADDAQKAKLENAKKLEEAKRAAEEEAKARADAALKEATEKAAEEDSNDGETDSQPEAPSEDANTSNEGE